MLLGMHVRVLPNEDSIINGETYLIMDLLAELEDGSLCNIEIQKQDSNFIFFRNIISLHLTYSEISIMLIVVIQ